MANGETYKTYKTYAEYESAQFTQFCEEFTQMIDGLTITEETEAQELLDDIIKKLSFYIRLGETRQADLLFNLFITFRAKLSSIYVMQHEALPEVFKQARLYEDLVQYGHSRGRRTR